MESPLDPALSERFANDLAAVWPLASVGAAQFALAVSGGPDSLALLVLAHAAFPGRFQVATVDHQLRRASADEANLVGAICARLGVAHSILAVHVAPGNLHERAREARYAALAGWMRERGLTTLCTAHHADDQAETVVMRLNRGSGVRGLAAIRPVVPFADQAIAVVRPLLGWRKAELEQIVAAAALVPVVDPSNVDPRFDRARVRAALADADWIDPLALTRSARHLAAADEAIGWMAGDVWEREAVPDGAGFRWSDTGAPDLVAMCVLERGIQLCGAADVPFGEVAKLFERVRGDGKSTLAGVVVDHREGVWHVAPAPPRRDS